LDWQVLCELSTRLGYPMNYASPEAVFAEFASLTASYRGLSYERLGADGKLWPCHDPEQPGGTAVLFSERFPTASGRAKFVPCAFQPARELPDADYPFVLNTGRLLEHWHTGTMTRRSSALDALQPGPFAELHPDELARLGVKHGDLVTIRSRRGAIRLPVHRSETVQAGAVFIPFHFREAAANVLTIDELDPYGKIPEFKFCAVRIEKD
jgi:formate dehydrogenase major subunit